MGNNLEVNPIDKKQEICSLLQKLDCQYEIHTSDSSEEYGYMDENDICITIPNPKSEHPIYVDLGECVITINSTKGWLYSGLSKTKIDKNYDYRNDIKKLPKEFQDEIRRLKGNIELLYWDSKDNTVINI